MSDLAAGGATADEGVVLPPGPLAVMPGAASGCGPIARRAQAVRFAVSRVLAHRLMDGPVTLDRAGDHPTCRGVRIWFLVLIGFCIG